MNTFNFLTLRFAVNFQIYATTVEYTDLRKIQERFWNDKPIRSP